MNGPSGDPVSETAAGINRIEGYLLVQSRIQEARRDAEKFADQMYWLTSSQRLEIVNLYTQDRMAVTKRSLEMTAARAQELRREYAARYAALKQRLLCICVATVIMSLALALAMLIVLA
ncbi:hypothetical protein [Streptomyces sp. NPDC002133]|uniref:hypothetical protein n=1 Tax=Streptomyces sp. NPDC002133 TaxID=3154409 RepID=UPI00332A7591